jgi:hypothetical protein
MCCGIFVKILGSLVRFFKEVLINEVNKMNGFAEVVDCVQQFDYEELVELNELTNKYIIELKREQITLAHKESMDEYNLGKLNFSSDTSELELILDSL